VLVTDVEGTVVFANAAAIARLGSDKHVGVPFAERLARLNMTGMDGRPLAVAEHPVALALARQEPATGITVGIDTEGARGWFTVEAVPLFAEGRVTGTVVVVHDATATTRLESELADHAARLEAIVNLVSDAVFVVVPGGDLIFANSEAERLLGRPAAVSRDVRARRMHLRDANGADIPPERFPSSLALDGITVTAVEYLVRDSDGVDRRVVAHAHPLRKPSGEIYAAVVTGKDITEERRARDEIEAARATAEEANRLKDQFLAALSHELRAPLQPILGWTEVLRRHTSLDKMTVHALEVIRRNIRQQVRLVDDLLDLSRITHGKITLRFETFDVREQVRAAVEPFEDAAAHRRVELRIALPPDPVLMWGDGARVQQIVTNLVSNAVKFTPADGRVSVRLRASDTEAVIEVEDTGEGIAPDDLDVIFDVFRQAGGRRGGLGIGLGLVKRLTELHGGTVIGASPGRHRGARFEVRFPLAAAPLAGPRAGGGAAGRLDRRSILVVEDNDDTRDVLRFMLEAEGARVSTAATGADGVAAARSLRPDIVLCDIGLPDVDGLEVARAVRGDPALAGARLIALTGYGQAEDVRQAVEAGFVAHLTKPINIDQLLALIADVPPPPPADADRLTGDERRM
jgi:PAS domain S-box-containing protein